MSDDTFEDESEEIEESEAKPIRPVKTGGADKSGKSGKPARKKKPGRKGIAKWFREMRSELKKVVWPTRKQVRQNTFVSLVVMAVSAVVLWAVDQSGTQIFVAITKLLKRS
ncbi:MAG: preprotein translocase subunit SecE [Oscillospiraceae bacterium]|jgi:preprotein translocase subunit SecE|nr:preprotein translocase subunit SecE [Oscillospiraceae bacterium]